MDAPPAPRVLLAAAWAAALATVGVAFPPFVATADWVNHSFLLRQVAAGWLADGLPPLLLDVPGWRGDPWFLFYGLGVYVPLSPLAWLVGAPWAIRLGALALHALLGWRVAQLVWAGTRSTRVAACVAALVLAAVFPISDLVARGGVVGFLAYELVAVALVSAVLGWTQPRAGLLVQACCAATLGALAHPPTFLLAAVFVLPAAAAVLSALAPPRLSRRQILAAAGGLALCAAVTALALSIVRPSLPYLGIGLVGLHHVIAYLEHTFDHPLARFFPLPLDLRGAATAGLPHVSAPFHGLLALVLLAPWAAALRARRLARRPAAAAAVVLLALVAALALSLPIWPAGPVPPDVPFGVRFAASDSLPFRLLAHVEFAYRLVGAQDLLLVLLVALTFASRHGGEPVGAWLARSRAAAALLIVATAVGLGGPVMEARRVRALGPLPGGERMLAEAAGKAFPSSFYALGTFSMSRAFPLLPPGSPAATQVATERGVTRHERRLRAECPRDCVVVTDIVPTRFVTVAVDGRPLPASALYVSGAPTPDGVSREARRSAERVRRIALCLPAGAHRVEFTLLPPWVRLFSPAIVAVLAAGLAAWLAGALARRRAPRDL